MNKEFKIDHGDIWWRYHVYQKVRLPFGLSWWSCIYKTENIEWAKDHIKQVSELPIYITIPAKTGEVS